MDRLTAKSTLNPFGEITIEAAPGDPNWQVRIFIFASDLRYNPGHAQLSKLAVLDLLSAIEAVVEAGKDPSNFNPVAVRERSFGTFGGLSLKAKYYPQGHFAVEFSAPSTTMVHTRMVSDVATFVAQLSTIIEIGDQMTA